MSRHWFRRSIALVALACAALAAGVLAPVTASAHDASEAPAELKLRAGLNDPKDPNIAVLEFLPEKISVVPGEKVTWLIDGPEPHSVTFVPAGSPVPNVETDPSLFGPSGTPTDYDGTTTVNSGVLPLPTQTSGATFTMTFTTAGQYTYYCVLHPDMTGSLTVGGDDINTQAETNAAAAKQRTKYLAEGRAAKKKLSATKPKGTKNSSGGTDWTVQMGASTAHTDVLAFAPTPAKVKAGDSVTFVNNSKAPHTASFGGSLVPQNPLAPEVQQPQPGPSPQTLASGVYLNTGWLPPNTGSSGAPLAARSYTYDVSDPGTYEYVCVLHLPSGMAAEIDAS
ncbi:MAG: plastocyanin/azurin family copper-binding protein [Acidimicrobiia bacterium]